ncbi:MAG: hypothetical protein ACTHJ0_08210 [Flavipsychrobacter sp.]
MSQSCEVWYDQYIKPESFSGRVNRKYLSSPKQEKTLVISSKDDDSTTIWSNEVYDIAVSGDSVYKPKGSCRYKIIHGDTTLYAYSACRDAWMNEYRSVAFNFCISGKYKNAYKEGILYYSRNHCYQEMEIGDMPTLFNQLAPGDSVCKLRGRVDIAVFKKDTALSIFPDWYK